MPEISQVGLKAKNFKSFGDDFQGFEQIKPINVIIGRNNTGKSTLLDLVEFGFSVRDVAGFGHNDRKPKVIIEWPIEKKNLETISDDSFHFQSQHNPSMGWEIRLRTFALGTFCGVRVRHEIKADNCELTDQVLDSKNERDQIVFGRVANLLCTDSKRFRKEFRTLRLKADRDVKPENEHGDYVNCIQPNGDGATLIVNDYLKASSRDHRVITQQLLAALNSIFAPDCEFAELRVQAHRERSNVLEIHVVEESKGRIPLTHMGSGFKTILLVLLNFLVVPQIESEEKSKHILFLFEELENNLHPSLQRRLFLWIRSQILKSSNKVFFTTHSNVVVDLFSDDPEAQILHVTHDGDEAKVRTVSQWLDRGHVLSDLGVRASDLLQSNGVIWVEGPSDAIYLRRWIELWSEGKFVEGVHYQCVFFGGSVGAHLSLADPEIGHKERLAALRVNRNAALLIDSDRRREEDVLKATTQRLIDEVRGIGGTAWVTYGREVENYIPSGVFPLLLAKPALRGPNRFSSVLDYVATNSRKFAKVDLARDVTKHLTRQHLADHLDLASRLDELCERIQKWNNLK